MRAREIGCLGVGLCFALLASGCQVRPDGERPFWMFWKPRGRQASTPLSAGIPAPPRVRLPTVPQGITPPNRSTPSGDQSETGKRGPAEIAVPALRTVYFEFDSAALTAEGRETLRHNARWLSEHPDMEVQVQGHCDERGTLEYNFNLGQRRADAAKAFLESLGLASDRIHTISYGEERPAVPGHNEEAWRLNRRVEFHAY